MGLEVMLSFGKIFVQRIVLLFRNLHFPIAVQDWTQSIFWQFLRLPCRDSTWSGDCNFNLDFDYTFFLYFQTVYLQNYRYWDVISHQTLNSFSCLQVFDVHVRLLQMLCPRSCQQTTTTCTVPYRYLLCTTYCVLMNSCVSSGWLHHSTPRIVCSCPCLSLFGLPHCPTRNRQAAEEEESLFLFLFNGKILTLHKSYSIALRVL